MTPVGAVRSGVVGAITGAIPDNNLEHHYDATEISGSDGDFIGTWADRVGSDDLTQTTGANQPTLKTGSNGINNNSILRFDGSSDVLSVAYSANITQPFEIFIVYRMQTNPNSVSPDAIIDADTNGGHQFGNDDGETWYIFQGSVQNGGTDDLNAHIADTRWRSSPSNDEVDIDGTVNVIQADSGDGTADGLTVGTRGDQASNYANVDAGEIAVYNTIVSTSLRTDIKEYFSDKWGVAV